MGEPSPIIDALAERIANGELESQCQHERVSFGGGLGGFCLDCGEDVMALRVEEWLRAHPARSGEHQLPRDSDR